MRKTILYIIAGVLLIAAFFAMRAIADSKDKEAPKIKKVVKTVFVDTIKNTDVPIIIPANGNLVAKRRVELYAEVQGIFKNSSNLFKAGQEYKRGQTLISIDASEYYASVQSSKSNLYNQITAIMPDLRLDYPDVFPKWEAYLNSFNINETTPKLPEISNDKEKYFINGRGILTTYYNVKNLEQRLGKYRISAPFTGVLTEALVTEGTLIRAGQKLGEFIDTSTYELQVSLNKDYADLLEVGENVELSNINKTKTYKGKVSRVNASIDQATQTVSAFIEVSNNTLKEGMYLQAELEARTIKNAISIDRGLVNDRNEIFTVKDSTLVSLTVNPVYFSDKKAVVKGVPNGEVILSKPVSGAYNGMLVKVVSNEPSAETNSVKQDSLTVTETTK
ncbi:efflux RND transporter periplasmic adaptor subunit [Croceibacter atlanticus]|jgi:membrane fusion protein (multidrug efflux system)|uniref:Secretion protein HlyD n=1 Tax=Croceibacter atlanticus (strain ATCC BAA-628 / JCM 21780 / CIP 108009 / IAM 15332 / KCTC 12090 / HTCC2559) TaxID=216432 RepID=A3U592_CROAH|nr:HlyD family efflux transporter periplasmic adaptor subunit [Croceibacter atlanticus]EAP87409.1 Secretion protein HlyD [Croceibacter atlanticus HTCC2559]MBW4970357.1 HlyD family efflux transporter periplasmic adaptor subunit [Croceibacter atlanticus]